LISSAEAAGVGGRGQAPALKTSMPSSTAASQEVIEKDETGRRRAPR
jgi:hypothetical protein